ncbi:hypothetical protein [Brachyspira intermedia]|nr:hypothetical protein [Brachyspira intermedia]
MKKTIIVSFIILMAIISCAKATNPEKKEISYFAGKYEGSMYFKYPNVIISENYTTVYINESESLTINNKYIHNDYYSTYIRKLALYSFKYTDNNSVYDGKIDILIANNSFTLTMTVSKDNEVLIPIFNVVKYNQI